MQSHVTAVFRAPCRFSEFIVRGEPVYLDLYKWHADILLRPSFDILHTEQIISSLWSSWTSAPVREPLLQSSVLHWIMTRVPIELCLNGFNSSLTLIMSILWYWCANPSIILKYGDAVVKTCMETNRHVLLMHQETLIFFRMIYLLIVSMLCL